MPMDCFDLLFFVAENGGKLCTDAGVLLCGMRTALMIACPEVVVAGDDDTPRMTT